MSDPATIARWVTAIACALLGGVFFAFSSFVMKALDRLPAHEGIAAMQSINVFAVKSWFLAAFLVTTLACLYLALTSFWRLSDPAAVYLITGSTIYLLGCFVVTMAANVPMNNALADLNPTDPASATYWAKYCAQWTAWNHLRTVSCLLASAVLLRGIV